MNYNPYNHKYNYKDEDEDDDNDNIDYYGQFNQQDDKDDEDEYQNQYDNQHNNLHDQSDDEESQYENNQQTRMEYQDFYKDQIQIDDDLFQGQISGDSDNEVQQQQQVQQQEQQQEQQEKFQDIIKKIQNNKRLKNYKPPSNSFDFLFDNFSLPEITKLINQLQVQKDQLFNFSAYKPSIDVQVRQQRHITYEIDQISILDVNFHILMETKKQTMNEINNNISNVSYTLFQDVRKLAFKGILRIRKQHQIGGVVQILSHGMLNLQKPTGQKQLKMDLKVSKITKIIFLNSTNYIHICYQGSPQFYLNIHPKPYENPNFHKNKTNLHKQRRYLTVHMLENDEANGTLKLKHCNKRWERLKNWALSYQAQNDLIMKYMGVKYGAVSMRLLMGHEELPGFMKVINKFQPVQLVTISTAIPILNVVKLREKYSMGIIRKQMKYLQEKYNIQCMQIIFSLISMLYQCTFVTIQQIMELIQQITKIVKNSQSGKEKFNVLKIRQTLVSINKQQLYLKMQNGTKLFKIFQNKLKKFLKRKSKFNYEDNIEVKALKATPSGLLPAGWTRDLRNRLVRQYQNNDFQFLKIQVTNDDQQRGRLFNGETQLTTLLNKMLINVDLFGYKFVPIGWTQSQLRTSSLWYTLQKNQAIPENIQIIPRSQFIHFLGEFDHIKNAALKAARIGQNLSTGKSINLQQAQIIYKNDDCSGKYLYTDGIGKISPDLIKKIKNQKSINGTALQIRFLGNKGILLINHQLKPNTIQIRESMHKFQCKHPDVGKYFDILDYNFYKPGYLNRQIIILLEANGLPLQKLKNVQKQYIKNILEQGFKFEQIVQDLRGDFDLANGFKQKLSKNFDPQKKALDNIFDIIKYMSAQKKLQISKQPTLRGIIIQKYHEMFERLIKKCQIKIQKSARILGVIDDYGILKENQVYCTILKDQETSGFSRKGMKKKMAMLHKKIQIIAKQKRMKQKQQKDKQNIITEIHENMQDNTNIKNQTTKIKKQDMANFTKQQIKFIKYWQQNKKKIIRENISGRVMLTRNPCMHPADIRVVNCVGKQEVAKRFKEKNWPRNLFEEITNCVIFPKSGKIPLTSQISGSDLDGDTFFITWDQRLIPAQSFKPFVTDDQIKMQRKFLGNDFPQMIEFFCEYVFNNNLGRLANSHLVHADQQGAFSPQCIQLCKIHNRAVDYPKKGYLFDFPKQLWVKQFPHFMEKGKEKKSYRSASVLGQLYDDAVGYYQQFCQKSKQFSYKLVAVRRCMGIKFTDKQIQQACKTVIEYNRQINKLLKMYSMKRQFQLYTMQVSHRSKQNRSRVAFIDDIKLKYLKKLFKGTKQNPFEYISQIKYKKNNRQENPVIIKRLLLWYMVSYTELFQIDKEMQSENNWMMKVRKILDGEKIYIIGLCWFCAPFLTQLLLKNISK